MILVDNFGAILSHFKEVATKCSDAWPWLFFLLPIKIIFKKNSGLACINYTFATNMYLEKAILHLSKDARLSVVLQNTQLASLEPSGNVYYELLNSIVSQQLSTRAANTIFSRFCALFPDNNPIPRYLTDMHTEQLRAVGLSSQKATYLKNVAAFALDNDFDNMDWNSMPDEDIQRLLIQIKGVGKWTTEMVLIFTLGRPDIFPIDDLGIQQAMIKLYGLSSTGKALHKDMLQHSEEWRPYRSTASRLLWRWKDQQNP